MLTTTVKEYHSVSKRGDEISKNCITIASRRLTLFLHISCMGVDECCHELVVETEQYLVLFQDKLYRDILQQAV